LKSEVSLRNLGIALLFLTTNLAVGLIALFTGLGHTELAFFSLSSIAIVTCLILGNVLPVRSFGIALYAEHPLAVYSSFYFLYYVPVYLLAFFSERIPAHNEARIAVLILVAYLGFWCGLKMSAKGRRHLVCLTFSQAKAMLLIAYFCAAMVFVHYAWLVTALGYYYTHAEMLVQPATVSASFAFVFAGSFELPLILLLGLLSRVSDPVLAKHARRFLWFYVPTLLFVSLTSSQFRLTVTALIFVFISLQPGKAGFLKLRYLAAVVLASILALLAIEAARLVVPDRNPASAHQILAGARSSLVSLRPALKGHLSDMGESVLQRAILPVQFLSDIIDATDQGRHHTDGSVAIESVEGLFPRVLWPEKPTLVSTQIRIERELGLPELDNSPGPVNEFYAEFGLAGVVLGYVFFGLFLGWLTHFALNSSRVLGWLILFWVWSAVAIVETDLVSGVLTSLRQALVVYLVYRVALLFVTSKRNRQTQAGLAVDVV
jgi:hypothetical protein